MLKAYLILMTASTIGGLNGIVIKWLNAPALTFTFFRLLVPTVVIFIYLKYKKVKIFKKNYRLMLGISALNVTRMFLYFFAFLQTSIANATIGIFTWPLFAALFGVFMLKEKPSKRTILLMITAFAGIALTYCAQGVKIDGENLSGILAALISSVIFALTMIVFKKETFNYHKTELIFFQNLVGFIVVTPLIAYFGLKINFWQAVTTFTFHGIIVGIVAWALFFYALQRIKISHYSLLSYWEVPASLIFAVLILHETLTWNTLLGGLLIMSANIGFVLTKYKNRPLVADGHDI